MAREEEAELKEKLKSAEDDLLSSLLPSAQDHDRGAIVEIRPGTGGDEASLFAADLSHLYRRYAEYQGWQCEVMEASTNDQGGFKLGSFAFSGPGAYVRLKHEGGTHRVQRVPRTEKEGRLHTSTATVVVTGAGEPMPAVLPPGGAACPPRCPRRPGVPCVGSPCTSAWSTEAPPPALPRGEPAVAAATCRVQTDITSSRRRGGGGERAACVDTLPAAPTYCHRGGDLVR